MRRSQSRAAPWSHERVATARCATASIRPSLRALPLYDPGVSPGDIEQYAGTGSCSPAVSTLVAGAVDHEQKNPRWKWHLRRNS